MRLRAGAILKLSLLAAVCCLGLSVGHASAATNDGPDQGDFSESTRYGSSYPGQDRTVDYTVATSAYNTILTNTLNVYLPAASGTVVVHDPNICYGTFRNGGRNYDQIDDGTGANWGNAVSFSMNGSTQWGYFDNAGTCDSPTLTFNLSGASIDLSTGMYKYTLNVVANAAGDKYMDTYFLTSPAGSYISQDSSQSTSAFGLNETSPIPAGDNPTNVQVQPNPYKDYWNGIIRFGPDCTVTTPTVTKRIEIFDDDNHNNWDVQPQPFLVRLQEFSRAGVYQRDVTPTITLPDGGGTSGTVAGGWYDIFGGGNAHRIFLDYTLNKDMVYQWQVDSVFYDNTLQFKIPFDSIYYYRACQTGNFNLQPNINVTVNGGASAGNVAEVNDTVAFTYAVNNTGSTGSVSVTCNIYGKVYTGYQSVPAPPDSSSDAGYVPPGTGCPRAFPTGNTTLVTETIPASTGNRTICRALWVNPSTTGGTSKGTEVCVLVTNKPYLRAYGGDVSAGNGFSSGTGSTCTINSEAAVVGWNKESAGSFAGAGAQFAVYALDQIYDVATALGNTGGAPAGSGLAFTNTTPSGGNFGGTVGSLPCISDYYGLAPTTAALTVTDLGSASLVTGAYNKTGPVTLSGTLTAVKRVSIYVLGDVIINNNITYPASWTSGDAPLVEIVAKGNIYVGSNVTQLDGVYIAQPSGASGGTIYTCSTGAAAVATNLLASTCGSKLTINGSFIANQVQFLRAAGSVAQSSAGETSAASKAAEVFNYGPAAWMPYPPGLANTTDYDSINSLPPIL
ncbi:MAG TPA: hypothetical protein VLH86_00940 [Patescibacteria group bacterium]|nr:hypothetical protein [Patescibacteria group bacterium]